MDRALFEKHLHNKLKTTYEAMDYYGFENLLIFSGEPPFHFKDDTKKTFKTNPYFNLFCPLQSQGHLIHLTRKKNPKLYFYHPDDHWGAWQAFKKSFWTECFDVIQYKSFEDIRKYLLNLKSTSLISAPHSFLESLGYAMNDERLMSWIDWARTKKTDYELACLKEANHIAAKGHKAVRSHFLQKDDASEFDLNLVFLKATQQESEYLPYKPIIALDKNASILHYENKNFQKKSKLLLIDAGCSFHGYASDITRTYLRKGAHDAFEELLRKLQDSQSLLCSKVKAEQSFLKIFQDSQRLIAKALYDVQVLKSPIYNDDKILFKVVSYFYPHSLGHMLGLQVHDVGGKQSNEFGQITKSLFSHLRAELVLKKNHVVTIEPGIYFNKVLMKKLKESKESQYINWPLVEEFISFGGMRIEDDVLVKEKGFENLTRKFLDL